MATAGEHFTRGGPDMSDDRGMSMVQKHADKMQKAKEEVAIAKMAALMPHIGAVTRELALQECHWDSERALALLRKFALANADQLASVQKERAQLEQEHAETRREAGAGAGDDSDLDSGSEDENRRRSRRHGKSKSSSKSKKKHKRGRSPSEKKRKHRRRSRDGSEEPRSKAVAGSDYGKHGILRETDMYAKRPEFMLWATEAKKLDIEILPKYEEKELFKEYMEDYNTATLPHKKYYDLELYEAQKAAKEAKRGAKHGASERTAFDDERELKREQAAARTKEQADRLRAAYEELQTTDKARDMREQELLRARMGLAYRMGDTAEAHRLAARLAPDDPANPGR